MPHQDAPVDARVDHARRPWGWLTRPSTRFGGTYGLLVSSSVLAALTEFGTEEPPELRDDAIWVLFAAVAAALAHGYAHHVAHRDLGERGLVSLGRAVLGEWLLALAAVPAISSSSAPASAGGPRRTSPTSPSG